MPILNWPTKAIALPNPSNLVHDSIIYPHGSGYPKGTPESNLYWGDNLQIMASLLPEYESRLDLIYADPPFFSNKEYVTRVGRGEDSRRPQDWQLVEGYRDQWDSLDVYLDFLYPRLVLMQRLLAPNGTLYLHLDWHADAYARLLLDELFGRENLLNEIIWTYHGPSPIRRAFNRKHDVILAYTKGKQYIFNTDSIRTPYHPHTAKTFASSPRAGFGKVPDLERGKVPEDWWYFPVVARMHNQRTGYPTQKPEALLERILLVSSNPESIVADFFCGSGTFPLVAARHGRRFLAGDISWRAIHTSRERVIDVLKKPFSIYRDTVQEFNLQENTFRVAVSDQTLRLINAPLLDYWEFDPDWNGKIFRSIIQNRRPNRSAKIPMEIKIPFAPAKGCVRAVALDGSLIQLNV